MSLFLANLAGFVVAKWRLFAVLAGILLLVVLIALASRACRSQPKLDHEQIQKAQQAIREQDRKEMIQVLAESDAREQAIDNSIKAAEQATEDAKQNYTGLTNDELADELNRRAKQ